MRKADLMSDLDALQVVESALSNKGATEADFLNTLLTVRDILKMLPSAARATVKCGDCGGEGAPAPVCADCGSQNLQIASSIAATTTCTMGVGCKEAGVCYAAAHGEPDRCEGRRIVDRSSEGGQK